MRDKQQRRLGKRGQRNRRVVSLKSSLKKKKVSKGSDLILLRGQEEERIDQWILQYGNASNLDKGSFVWW